jgi:thioredoxin-dependent peroxiredoxin
MAHTSKESRIEQQSVFVVDRDGIVRYLEYVPQIGRHPDHEAAVSAAKNLLER